MRTALALARRGMGAVRPNPPVGAVLVKDGEIVGRGWHQRAGEDHAEVMAIKEAGDRAAGSCLFVTLEPCAHHGKTPPCTDAIIEAGITLVHVARRDTNPTSGHGTRVLREAGIEVVEGLGARGAAHLLAGFQSLVDAHRPRVTLKLATSLDGRLASGQGDSRWISNEIARAWVHRRREEADAVMIGAGTALADNPALTARVARRRTEGRPEPATVAGGPRHPDRIVIDGTLRVPPKSRPYADNGVRRIVITTETAPAEAEKALQEQGVEVWRVRADGQGRVDLHAALGQLCEAGYTNILCEGGGQLSGSLIREQLADVLHLFVAPHLVLGADGPSWTEGVTVASVPRGIKLTRSTIRPMGSNWLITAVPEYAQWTDPDSVQEADYNDLKGARAASGGSSGEPRARTQPITLEERG